MACNIVFITSGGYQKMDFVHELHKRTGSVTLIIKQKQAKSKIRARFCNYSRKVGFARMPMELFYTIRVLLNKERHKLYGLLKTFTPHTKEADRYLPKTIEVSNINGRVVEECIAAAEPSIIAIWGGPIIKGEILNQAEYALNMHAGLCPYYRGSNGNQNAIVEGKKNLIGATIHHAVASVDAGPIIETIQEDVRKPAALFFRDLNDRSSERYLSILESFANRRELPSRPQEIRKGHNYLMREWTYHKQFKLLLELKKWNDRSSDASHVE